MTAALTARYGQIVCQFVELSRPGFFVQHIPNWIRGRTGDRTMVGKGTIPDTERRLTLTAPVIKSDRPASNIALRFTLTRRIGNQ